MARPHNRTADRRRAAAAFPLVLLVACQAVIVEPPHDGHSHNDYRQAKPLHDALAHGFASAEADVFLVDGELRIGHERDHILAGTLQSLYLEPLRVRARDQGGRVCAAGGTFTLLVDIKANATGVYAALEPLLDEYRDLLTSFRDDGATMGAVTVILSGDRPRERVAAQSERLCALDGRPEDLDTDPPPSLVPWISDAWSNQFGAGTTTLDEADHERLRAFVARAHAQGRRVRFWGTPDRPEVWELQRAAGVDLVNTDRLADYAAWSRRQPR